MAFPPNTFASQSGNVGAVELDQNFQACFPLSSSLGSASLVGSTTPSGNNQSLTAGQAYSIIKSAIPWEVVSFMGGNQTVSTQQVLRYQPSTDVVISTASCASSAGVAFTAGKTFAIADNGSTIGNVTYSASGSTGTVAISGSPYTVTAGHVLTINGPASADATGANVNFTLGGTRG